MELTKENIFWRFYLPIIGSIFVVSVIAAIIISIMSKNIFYTLQERENLTVLKNVLHLVSRFEPTLEQYRQDALEYRKRTIVSLLEMTRSLLDTYYNQIKKDDITVDEARYRSYNLLKNIHYGRNDYIFVVNSRYEMVVHPDPKMVSVNLFNLRDPDGIYVIRELVNVAKQAKNDEVSFVQYRWYRKDDKNRKPEPKISGAFYYEPWDWVVGTGVYIRDIDEMVENRRMLMLNTLKLQLAKIKLGENGYIYVFDEAGNIIYHPVLSGNIKNMALKDPETGRLIYDELVETARRSWGKNFLKYRWDRPDDKGHYIYPKITWCAREPNTGWYVASSVYEEEIEAPVKRFVCLLSMPAIATIVILGFILFILLRKLLNPIKALCVVCDRVRNGDFSVRARGDIGGEIGFLAGQFNRMVESIALLRENDKNKTEELEELNQKLEDLVDERTKELEQKALELEKAVSHLKELDKMKSVFLSSVSHELRTPLTSILGFAKLIYKDFRKFFLPLAEDRSKLKKKGARIEDNVSIIIAEGERLTRLINDVLDLAKIESGRIEWKDVEFAASEFLEQAARAVEGQFASRPSVEFCKEISDDLPLIAADKDRLIQVVINLLNNAAKFTEEGRVILSACVVEDKLRVTVEDTGVGISPEDLEKVFDKFHQVADNDTLKDKPKGTGLGLSISKQIIEHYGGRIWVESEPGQGSKFIFELPIARRPEDNNDRQSAELDTVHQDPGSRDAPLVLVVDDDPGVRKLLMQILEEEGYQVCTAENGRDGLEKAMLFKPDLITMDLMMPVMDGREAINQMRQEPELCGIPIVVVSVLPDSESAGGVASITKPIDEQTLIETVDSLLKRKVRSPKPCIVLEDEYRQEREPNITLCRGEVLYCSVEQMWQEIERGFTGTVMIPAGICEQMDLKRLSFLRGVQLVILN